MHRIERFVDHGSQLRLFDGKPHGETTQILARGAPMTHGVLQQSMHERAPRLAGIRPMRRRVGHHDLRRVVSRGIDRTRHARDVSGLLGHRRDRPGRLVHARVHFLARLRRRRLDGHRAILRYNGRRGHRGRNGQFARLPQEAIENSPRRVVRIPRPPADDQQLPGTRRRNIQEPIFFSLQVGKFGGFVRAPVGVLAKQGFGVRTSRSGERASTTRARSAPPARCAHRLAL